MAPRSQYPDFTNAGAGITWDDGGDVYRNSVDLDPAQLAEYASLFLEASSDVSTALGGRFPERFLVKTPERGVQRKDET